MIKTGMTSVTFRSLSCGEIVDLCAECGLDGIEWGGDIHVPCGDFDNAAKVRELSLIRGLEVFSYGSYYRAGETNKKEEYIAKFDKVSLTAEYLGCKVIRIWPGIKASALYSEAEKELVAEELKEIARIAARRGQVISFEYHQNTLTDCKESALLMLKRIGAQNVKTYWQPIAGREENLKAIELLSQYITNVHVYHWKGLERFPLSAGKEVWREYFSLLKGKPHNFILEFCLNDDVEVFKKDVKTLREIVNE